MMDSAQRLPPWSQGFENVPVPNRFPPKVVNVVQRSRTRQTILVVEDYADSRQMLKLLLEDVGYSVVTAASGKEALAAAANCHIDLVLVDFGLPDMTGANVIRRLRRMGDRMTTVPIVMLTAFDGYEYRRLANEAGCDVFLVKPPDFEVLRGTLERMLRENDPAALRRTNVALKSLSPY